MRLLTSILSLLCCLVMSAPAEGKLHVVASIETFADLAHKIGGDRVEVTSLSRGWTDPHFVEGKPSLVLALNRADLLIHVGLELEIGWLPPLVLASRNDKIQLGAPGNLDASVGIPVLDVPQQKVDRSLGDIHPQGNPHYYIAPEPARVVAKEIAERLEQIDPAGRDAYEKNLAAFLGELARKEAEWSRRAAGLKGLKIVTYHKSWTYMSRWLGLDEIGYVENKPGIPPSPSHIAQLIGEMRQQGAKLVILESFYPRSTVDLVADKAGARAVVLPANVGADGRAKDYFSMVDEIIDDLTQAAK